LQALRAVLLQMVLPLLLLLPGVPLEDQGLVRQTY
jgi:hypothetical protein